eukprot:TRINITY_DN4509_c0_g3_i1.p1 TRINITY_DN4509_c0_g3~~TRINITY_DN4509_c0_g3_i1.p1  ORF type:complete len:314 (+),score=53.22 TRINITY_DN4509_c0_g3_i1:62-1003(+)
MPWCDGCKESIAPVAIAHGNFQVSIRDVKALPDVLQALSSHSPNDDSGLVYSDMVAGILQLSARASDVIAKSDRCHYAALGDAMRPHRERLSASLWEELSSLNAAASILRKYSERFSDDLIRCLKEELRADPDAQADVSTKSSSTHVADITDDDEFYQISTRHASTQTIRMDANGTQAKDDKAEKDMEGEMIESAVVLNILTSRFEACRETASQCQHLLQDALVPLSPQSVTQTEVAVRDVEDLKTHRQFKKLTESANVAVCELDTLVQLASNIDGLIRLAGADLAPSKGYTLSDRPTNASTTQTLESLGSLS